MDSSYQKISNNNTNQTPKDILLKDNGDGTYSISTAINQFGGTRLNTNEFYLEVSKGNIVGHKMINKFGKNSNVSTATFDAIWNGGGVYTGFYPTVAETITAVSSSADDTFLGIGAQQITFYGLSGSGLEITETLNMNGLTPVTSSLSYLRCDRVKVVSTGDGVYSANNGIITVAQSITTANVFAVLPIGYNSTMITAYTIPADKTGYLYSRVASIDNKQAATADIRAKLRVPGGPFMVIGESTVNSQGTGYINRQFTVPPRLPPLSDIVMEAKASATVAIAGFFDIMLVDNE